VLFVLMWVISIFFWGDMGDSDADIRSWFADSGNRHKQEVSYFVILASSLFFVWFVAVLRGRLAQAEGKPGARTALAFGAGLVAVALWTVGDALFATLAFTFEESDGFVLDPNTFRVIDNLGYGIWTSGTTMAALLVFATALSSLKGQIVPKWLAWLSVVVAASMLFAVFFLPFLVFLGWVLVVSLWMIWKPAETAAPAATG
jgi:hypothetical protein